MALKGVFLPYQNAYVIVRVKLRQKQARRGAVKRQVDKARSVLDLRARVVRRCKR